MRKETTGLIEPPKVSAVLRQHFLCLDGVTQENLAETMGVSRHSINELMNGKRTITAPMALRLARVLGTDAEFWLNLQQACDLFDARKQLGSELEGLTPLRVACDESEVVQPLQTLRANKRRG
jgi:addiction module HigA family antidote